MEKRNIIVIGASAGGFDVIRRLVDDLPADLDASVFIVWHMSPDVKGILPQVLNKLQKMPATHAVDREPVRQGRIYIAPPDHHMLLEGDVVRITRGPKENRFRPAIDPLFRSAALAYGSRVIGVILSGALDDGTAGLWNIKQSGGLAVVQHPEDAGVTSMPESAIRAVPVDHIMAIAEMGKLLTELAAQQVQATNGLEKDQYKRIQREVDIAMEDNAIKQEVFQHGKLTPYTCPECHGVLAAITEGGRIRFRCHTGHGFTADSLLAAIGESIEDALWNAVRNVQESVMLLNHMGDHFASVNDPRLAATYFIKAKEAENRAEIVRRAVLDHEQLSQDNIKEQSDQETENS